MNDNGAVVTAEDEEPQSLGGRMQRARERAGLSARSLARRLGRSPVTLSRWENDHQPPGDEDLEAYADAVGVPAIVLLRGMAEFRRGQEHAITEAETRGYERALAVVRERFGRLLDEAEREVRIASHKGGAAPVYGGRPPMMDRAEGLEAELREREGKDRAPIQPRGV